MIIFYLIRKKVLQLWSYAPWWTLSVVFLATFFVGYLVMVTSEPRESSMRHLGQYAWWFMVTITTTGYGDITPVSGSGRFVTAVILVVGFGIFGFAIAKMTEISIQWSRKIMKGLGSFDYQGHIVIFGNRGDETYNLIRALTSDPLTQGKQLILVSFQTEENPFPGKIEFVRAELSSEDAMKRASVGKAAKAIIHAKEDAETLVVALAVKHHNPQAHIVVNLNHISQEVNIHRIDSSIVCIKPVDVAMMVREIHNPGISQVLENLLSAQGQDLRSVVVPEGDFSVTFGPLAHSFREKFKAILIGLRYPGESLETGSVVNPSFDARIVAGTFLFYISSQSLDISWQDVLKQRYVTAQ